MNERISNIIENFIVYFFSNFNVTMLLITISVLIALIIIGFFSKNYLIATLPIVKIPYIWQTRLFVFTPIILGILGQIEKNNPNLKSENMSFYDISLIFPTYFCWFLIGFVCFLIIETIASIFVFRVFPNNALSIFIANIGYLIGLCAFILSLFTIVIALFIIIYLGYSNLLAKNEEKILKERNNKTVYSTKGGIRRNYRGDYI